jgi:site-specific DNA-methyltransferase (adenine-specific)
MSSASVVERIEIEVGGQAIIVEHLSDGTFRKPAYLAGAEREVVGHKSIAYPDSDCWGTPNKNIGSKGVWGGTIGKYDPGGTKPITAPATPLSQLWDGWKTALKPAVEFWIVVMKPIEGTFAANAEKWGVSGLNIDGARVETNEIHADKHTSKVNGTCYGDYALRTGGNGSGTTNPQGRYPANLILECNCSAGQGGKHAEDCVCGMLDRQSGKSRATQTQGDDGRYRAEQYANPETGYYGAHNPQNSYVDKGGASRFFYCSKASRNERTCNGEIENKHPTVKPLTLMEYLCTLTRTPTGGIVLDPFMGSGSTGVACVNTGRDFVGIERAHGSFKIAERRIEHAMNQARQLEFIA